MLFSMRLSIMFQYEEPMYILTSQAGSWLSSLAALLVSEEITCNVPIRSTHAHYYGFSLHRQEVGSQRRQSNVRSHIASGY